MSNCKVIALTNQKGGVGKTTTAVNLGVGLAKQGKRVLLIDADVQANLTMALGYSRPDDLPVTLSTIMQNIIDDKSFDVSQGILSHSEGVDLLPSNIELSGFEVRLINAMSRERVLKTYVNEVKKNYDYVLIDCMPSLGMITINALAAADSVVIPTQPHYLSAKGLELLLRSVSMVKRQINVLNSEPVYFDVMQENSEIDSGITVIEVVRSNVAQKGTITVSKSGEVFSSVNGAGGLYQPVYAVRGLEGAVYGITAAEDIYTLDGTLRASKGEVVDTVTTGADGTAVSKELYLGKYEVKEITAPFGMVLNEEIHAVELVYGSTCS